MSEWKPAAKKILDSLELTYAVAGSRSDWEYLAKLMYRDIGNAIKDLRELAAIKGNE